MALKNRSCTSQFHQAFRSTVALGAHVWAKWLHHPCRLGGPQRSVRGRKSEMATSSLPSWGPTCGQSVGKLFGLKNLCWKSVGQQLANISLPFPPFPPLSPPCFLVAEWEKTGIACPSREIPPPKKSAFLGFSAQESPILPSKSQKISHYPPFPPVSLSPPPNF